MELWVEASVVFRLRSEVVSVATSPCGWGRGPALRLPSFGGRERRSVRRRLGASTVIHLLLHMYLIQSNHSNLLTDNKLR